MKKALIEIHCEEEGGWLEPLLSSADSIDTLMMDGYEIEIKVIVDGTRRVIFRT